MNGEKLSSVQHLIEIMRQTEPDNEKLFHRKGKTDRITAKVKEFDAKFHFQGTNKAESNKEMRYMKKLFQTLPSFFLTPT